MSEEKIDRKETIWKPSPILMPWEADEAYTLGSDFGLDKYGNRETWKNNTPEEGSYKYADAAMRHLKAHFQIEEIDPKSGVPHLASAVWNSISSYWHYRRGCDNSGIRIRS